MKEYVNAFGIEIPLTKEEHTSLAGRGYALFTYDNHRNIWTMEHYKKRGLKAVITADSPPQKENRTIEDSLYTLRFEVTLPKLLTQGKSSDDLTKRSTIEDACKKFDNMMRDIEKINDVNLRQKARLFWIALAKDVTTPNDFYSQEIIEAAYNTLGICRYQNHGSFVDDLQSGVDYVTFVCNNESCVLYNKKHDLLKSTHQAEVKTLGEYGLLCFELTIYANMLKKDYSIENFVRLDSLPEILYQLTIDGNTLLNKYLAGVFCKGAMLSKKVLKEYLKTNCKMGQKEIKSMIDFSDWIRKMGSESLMCYGTFDQVRSQVAGFEKLKIAPVRLSKRCPYIPSFSDLLNDTVDDKMLSFAQEATLYKDDLTYWNFGEMSKSGKK